MAPINPDGDINSSNKTENPFIKFRRFADAEVGALLQGIIGLPSAFSKQSNESTSRWTDFQDELRRREKAHTNEKTSEISETSNRVVSDEEEVELPVKILRGGLSPASVREESPDPNANTAGGSHQYEYDLYCPITPALFENTTEDTTWFTDNLKLPWEFFSNRKTGSALSIIQSMVYNEIYFDSGDKTNLRNHMENSIIPYVLFSPYSPLALSNMPTPSKGQGLHGRNRRDFPFMAAFEDLLLASQNRPMGLWTHVRGNSSAGLAGHYDEMLYAARNVFNISMNPEFKNTRRKVSEGLSWVRSLDHYGLLGLEPTEAERCCSEQPVYLQVADHKPCGDVWSDDPEDEYMPELEAYDTLMMYDEAREVERQPFSPQSLWRALSTFDDGNVIVREILRKIEENDEESHGNNSVGKAEPSGLEYIVRGLFAGGQKSTSSSTQTKSLDDSSPPTIKNRVASTKQDTGEQESKSRSAWPISTTRTTEQTTNESGTVETKITIEKIFADGRRNVTITEHVEVPFERSRGMKEGHVETRREGKEEAKRETVHVNAEGMQHKGKEKKNKGGWFWN